MSFIYSQSRSSDPYSDVLSSGGRGDMSISSKMAHHSPSYFDAPSSMHQIHPDLKVVDSIEHDLKREYELEARRNYERERELEDEREVVGRGYLHEREELERERRTELDRDRRVDIRDRFESRQPIRTRNTKVVVDNLPYSVKWQEFKEFMKKVGEVIFADVFTDQMGKSKGCGIVEYASIDSAERALSDLDGQDFLGRRVSVREDRYPEVSEHLKRNTLGIGRSSTSASFTQNSGGDPACTVFVGNLDYDVTWQRLKDVFRVAGIVIRTDIFTDRDGRSRGYGTVEYSLPKEALNAIVLFHGQMLSNRPMLVRMDKANLHPTESSGMKALRSPETQRVQFSSLERKRREIALRELEVERMHEDRIVSRRYLDNFALGRDSIDSIRRIRDPYDDLLLSRDFRRDSLSDRYRDSEPLFNRDLLDYPLPNPKRSRVSLLNRTFSPPPIRRDLIGSREPFRARKGDGGGPNRTVFVRNLPYAIGWQELKDIFRDAGGFVANADVAKDDTGKSRGFGLVTFDSTEDAKRAIEKFDGFELKGRKLEVRMDKFE